MLHVICDMVICIYGLLYLHLLVITRIHFDKFTGYCIVYFTIACIEAVIIDYFFPQSEGWGGKNDPCHSYSGFIEPQRQESSAY